MRVYDEAGNVIGTHEHAVPEVIKALTSREKVAIAAKAGGTGTTRSN
jgi:hypothetical protein